MAHRIDVFSLIDEERDYQDSLNGRFLVLGEELVLLREYLRRAENTFTETFHEPAEVPTLHVVRKIAALAVRCLEHHSCPSRKEEGTTRQRLGLGKYDPSDPNSPHHPDWAGRVQEGEGEK